MDMWNMDKRENNPLVNYNFMLRVEGMFDLPCKSVQGFQNQMEYEYIQEGGVNDYVHIRRKPVQNPGTIQVERYVINESKDYLAVGAFFEKPMQLLVARYPGEFNEPRRIYSFNGCVVASKQYGQLSAEQSGILTETMTIVYQSVKCTDTSNEKLKEVWKFDGKKKEGNNVRAAKKLEDYGIKETDFKKANKNARRWPDVSSAKNIKNYLEQK